MQNLYYRYRVFGGKIRIRMVNKNNTAGLNQLVGMHISNVNTSTTSWASFIEYPNSKYTMLQPMSGSHSTTYFKKNFRIS